MKTFSIYLMLHYTKTKSARGVASQRLFPPPRASLILTDRVCFRQVLRRFYISLALTEKTLQAHSSVMSIAAVPIGYFVR